MIQYFNRSFSIFKVNDGKEVIQIAESISHIQIGLDSFLGAKFQRIPIREFTDINTTYIEGKRLEDYYFTRFPIKKSIVNPRCPLCGSRRISLFESQYRTVRRLLGIVEDVEIARYLCKKCHEPFSAAYEDAPPQGHFHYEVIWAAVDLATRLTESLRHAETFLNEHLKVGVSHTDIHYWVQKSGACLEELRTKLVPPFSGYLGIDEFHLTLQGGKIYVLGYSDAKTHAFLDFDIVEGKDTQSYSDSITHFLAKHPVQDQLKAVITDDFPTFTSIIPNLFPKCPHQLCIFHGKGTINKRIYAAAQVSFKKALPPEYQDLKAVINELFEAATPTHAKYWLYAARSVQIRHGLENNKGITKLLQKVETDLEQLTHFIEDPDCPGTNNGIEQIWSLIRPRKEIMKSFNSRKSIKNYFNLLQTAMNFKIYKTWCQTHPTEAEKLPFKITVDYWFQYINFSPKKTHHPEKSKSQKKHGSSE